MDKSTIYQLCIFACAVGVAGFTLLGFRALKDEQKKDQLKQQTESSAQWDRIEARSGDQSALGRYIEVQKYFSQQYAGLQATEAFSRFVASKEEREKTEKGVQDADARALAAAKIAIAPISDLVVSLIDGWVTNARAKHPTIQATKTDGVMAAISGAVVSTVTYKIAFENGASMSLTMQSALISGGKWQRICALLPLYHPAPDSSDGWQFQILIGPGDYQIQRIKEGPYTFSAISRQGYEPSKDQEFLEAVTKAVNEMMGYILQRSAGL